MDVPERCVAQADCRRNIEQAAFHQDHVRRVDGNVGAGADGNADVGSRQSGRVVDAVADHCRLALCLEFANLQLLALRQDARDDLVDTCLPADCLCRPLIIAREHDDADAHVLQLAHRLRAVFFDHVRHGNHAEQLSVQTEIERRLARIAAGLRLLPDLRGDLRLRADEGIVAAAKRLSFKNCFQAVSGQRLKFRHVKRRKLTLERAL